MKTCLFPLIGLWVFASCDKIENRIKIKIAETSAIVIPSNVVIDLPVNISTPEQESSLEEELVLNNSRKDKVKTIRLMELTMTITNPSGRDFNFLNSIHLFIKAGELPEREIAYLDHVPNNNSNSISINIYNDDLADYLKQDKFILKAKVKTDELITSETTVEIYSGFEVTADIF